jgi:hypothetical protein
VAQYAVAAESDDRPYTPDQTDLALRIMLELRDKYSDEKEFVDVLDMYIDQIENDDGGNNRSAGSASLASPPVVKEATIVEATSLSPVKEQPPQAPPAETSQVILMPSNLNPGVANEFLNPAPIEVEDHNNNMHHHSVAATPDGSSGSAIYAPPPQEDVDSVHVQDQ